MPVTTLRCPDCGASLKTQAEIAPGQKIRCPKCKAFFAPDGKSTAVAAGAAPRKPGAGAAESLDDVEVLDEPPRGRGRDDDGPRGRRRDEDSERRPRRDDDDAPRRRDDDEDERPRKKKKRKKEEANNKALLLTLFFGGAGVVAVGVILLIVFGQTETTTKKGGGGPVAGDKAPGDKGGGPPKLGGPAKLHGRILDDLRPRADDGKPAKTLAEIEAILGASGTPVNDPGERTKSGLDGLGATQIYVWRNGGQTLYMGIGPDGRNIGGRYLDR